MLHNFIHIFIRRRIDRAQFFHGMHLSITPVLNIHIRVTYCYTFSSTVEVRGEEGVRTYAYGHEGLSGSVMAKSPNMAEVTNRWTSASVSGSNRIRPLGIDSIEN